MSEQYINSTTANGITTIEFFTRQHNSLPGAVLRQLATTITEAGHHPDSGVIILRSGGEKTFCAGANFDELLRIDNEADGLHFFSGFAHVINAMRECPKLIIGRVQGKAIGGGVGIAASCDYTFATASAEVKLSELAVGIGPFVVGPAVERKIGLAAFSELAVDAANFRSAEWAHSKGLYNGVYNSIAGMDEAIAQLANTLSQSSADAMRELKQIFWQGTAHWNELLPARAAISGRLILTNWSRNAIEKFKHKG
jgi:methylglutaconyl-CoA hydratase